jgi:hypothetical protein
MLSCNNSNSNNKNNNQQIIIIYSVDIVNFDYVLLFLYVNI